MAGDALAPPAVQHSNQAAPDGSAAAGGAGGGTLAAGQQPPAGPAGGGGAPGGARVLHTNIGVAWILGGTSSYVLLSLAARALLHCPAALQLLKAQVPHVVYERSLAAFGTAFVLDVLGVLFEAKSSRLDMVLLPAFVKGAATATNALAASGWACVALSSGGGGARIVLVQRYLCWMHTTPTILLLVQLMSVNITRRQAMRAIACVELMLLTGLAGSLTAGWTAAAWGLLSHLAFLPLLPYLHQGLTEAAAVIGSHAAWPATHLLYALTMLMWAAFGLIWDLRMLGAIGTYHEELGNLVCDFAAKVMFSAGLMLGAFKSLDSRREGVMRQIQEAHRQTLLTELQRAIEQKDNFMSSVSHELRTPLNGIIGVSEGLLAGCCGVLNEAVRRQIYVLRTSGARLLALINDVMDAAALRQQRLVLKPEKFELRQLVGDVVDLMRSLVDSSVSLRNDVPEGLVMWADSGRMIQILNNLLGNAAKFTHRGTISVSAAWHDAHHQWVAVSVTDTGIGIAKSKLPSIFLPFTQVDGSISRQYGGFGLGLSVTQELVRAHGGELWVSSREHKGSRFTLTLPSYTGQQPNPPQQQAQAQQLAMMRHAGSAAGLPLLQQQQLGGSDDLAAAGGAAGDDADTRELPYDAAQLAALGSRKFIAPTPRSADMHAAASSGDGGGLLPGAAAPAPAASLAREPRPTQFACSGRYRVLSVDDDPVNQAVVQSLLASTGYEVVCCSAAQTCDTIDAADVLPDLILEHIDMNGPEVCRKLAARQPPLGIPIILVSARTEEDNVVHGIDSGADDYITKPFRRAEFLARVRAKLQLASQPSTGMGEQAAAAAGQGSDAPLVVCVDDDEVSHLVLAGMLQSQGYRYQKVASGAEALRLLDAAARQPPNLVLLNAALPDTTGLDVLRGLRQRASQVALPVIVLTAHHTARAIVEALDAGANDYVIKPLRRAELLARIRMHLRSTSKAAAAAAATVAPALPTTADGVAAGVVGGSSPAALLSPEQQAMQRSLGHAETLEAVPVLVLQLEGLDAAAAAAAGSADAMCQLLGYVADCCDAMVEKYALVKVESTDDCLVVACLISSSCSNSTRTSLQLPPLPAAPAAQGPRAGAATGSQPQQQQQQQQQGQGSCAPLAARTSVAAALLQLLQMAQELAGQLGAAASQGSQQPATAGPPRWWRGLLGVRVAVHVGPLHAAVVGRRRPRHRLMGAALQEAKQACAAAPLNASVATAEAAQLLSRQGVSSLTPLCLAVGQQPGGASAAGGAANSGSSSSSSCKAPQLWCVGALAAGAQRGAAAAAAGAEAASIAAVLQQAARTLTAVGSHSLSSSASSALRDAAPAAQPPGAPRSKGLAPAANGHSSAGVGKQLLELSNGTGGAPQAGALPPLGHAAQPASAALPAGSQLWNPLVPVAAAAPQMLHEAAAALGLPGLLAEGLAPGAPSTRARAAATPPAGQPPVGGDGKQAGGESAVWALPLQLGAAEAAQLGVLYQELSAMQQQISVLTSQALLVGALPAALAGAPAPLPPPPLLADPHAAACTGLPAAAGHGCSQAASGGHVQAAPPSRDDAAPSGALAAPAGAEARLAGARGSSTQRASGFAGLFRRRSKQAPRC